MPNGISGSNAVVLIGGDPTANLLLIETRVQNVLLGQLLGTDQSIDELGRLRDDQAFQLGIPVPLPGAGM